MAPRALALLLPLTAACASSPSDLALERVLSADLQGLNVTLERRARYSALDAVRVIQLIGLDAPVQTSCGFLLFKVEYETTDASGEVVPVSGLMAVPEGEPVKGVVSWHHGTNPTRAEAMSSPGSLEALLMAAVFAGDGYVLLAPDYIGLGDSLEIPPYLHVASTVPAVVDLLDIGGRVAEALGGGDALALIGFSQGGTVTAAVQRALQEDNPTSLELRAAAGVAGPYDLRHVAIPYAIAQEKTFYLAYLANAYSVLYGQPLSSLIQEDYLDVVPELFDGSADHDEIDAGLPDTMHALLTPELLEDIAADRDNWFTLALEENQTWAWVPETELRIYYGEEDGDVSPEDALGAFAYMHAEGGAVRLVNTGPLDHDGTAFASLPQAKAWFDDMTSEEP